MLFKGIEIEGKKLYSLYLWLKTGPLNSKISGVT